MAENLLAQARASLQGDGLLPEAEEPSLLEGVGRGLKQGATFGFGDELTGVLESAFSSKTYRQARDEARANDEAARAAHPWGFGLGQVLGGVATAAIPVGAAAGAGARAAGLGAQVARGLSTGALTGAASGLGESQADLTKGDVAGAAKDTALGAGIGAATGAVLGPAAERLVGGAPARADKRLISDLADRATPTTRARLARTPEIAERTAAIARGAGLEQVARNPAKLVTATEAASDAISGERGAILAAADGGVPEGGIARHKVIAALGKVERDYRAQPESHALADAMKQQIDALKESWSRFPKVRGDNYVPATEVNRFASALGGKGFAGTGLEPKPAQELARDAWGAVRRVLDEHVEQVLPGQAKEFNRLGRHQAVLIDIAKAAAKRTQLDAYAPSGIRQIAGHGYKGLGMLGAVAGHPEALLATHVAPAAAQFVGRQSTAALAALVRAARAGSPTAALVQGALEAGVPRGTVEAITGAKMAPAPEEE